MKKIYTCYLIIATALVGSAAQAQLQIHGPMHLQAGAVLTVQDLVVNATQDVSGTGTLNLTGTTNTSVNTTNNLPNVTINKTGGSQVTFTGNPQINGTLDFTSGMAEITTSNLYLNDAATVANASSSKYIKTLGSGNVIKRTSTALTSFNLPVGTSTAYAPVAISNTCICTGAELGARAVAGVHPSKISSASDHLNIYWPITKSGTMASASAMGTYQDPSNIVGTENKITGALYTSGAWDYTSTNINTTNNTVGASITGSGDLYGQNAYLYVKAKALLGGPLNTAGNLMSDALRTAPALIPTSDPYRTAPYSTNFVHVNNPTTEIIASSVLNAAASTNDNIVDWVFLELRNTTSGNPGANKVKTRSALIQRDGDIVDVDGTSPVLFMDVTPGNYALAVRHRNHLAMCTEPTAPYLFTLNANPSAATLIDLTSMTDAQLFGTVDVNYALNTTSSKNIMYAGNANMNTRISAVNLNNDKDRILLALSNNASNLAVTNVYNVADLNMNRNVRAVNLNNDKDVLFKTLSNNANNIKNQALPQ
jgi:hypothetical protein